MTSPVLVGRVAALWRHPVKSMASEALSEVDVSWHGLTGDRRWAFVRDDVARNGFPWLTIRQRPDLVRYRPTFTEPDRPDSSGVTVATPSGKEFDVLDPVLAAELGVGVRAMKLDRGTFDALPLSLLTTRTVADLGTLVDADLDIRRFRPNLVVEAVGDAEFPEDAWVGRGLRIGGLRMRADRRDKRCAIVNVDPETAHRDPGILRTVARERDLCLGVYGSVVEPGRVAVGDAVLLDP
ncbi:MOSC N-terminal beta barrel domain-containing protein [Longispora sp. NPDC051575]|uniref:MOSC domain-containing protein n=1 Tax=Longispora sp. NPDC051575 TaxID=3154943 RepID=UPI00341BF8AB